MPNYTITDICRITDRISQFSLVASDRTALPAWTAGAHIDVSTSSGTRSYSLIRWSATQTNSYEIAVQLETDGDGGSRAMHELRSGAQLTVSDPKNDFELQLTSRPVALLAGGIGVTPMISMAASLAERNHPFSFYYTGRSRTSMAYLAKLQDQFGASLQTWFDDEVALNLPELIEGLVNHDLYICGPKGMIDAARTAAEAAGMDKQHIHVELFQTAAGDESANEEFEVEISDTGEVITVAANQTIIEALEAAGHDVMYDCQRGDCGICQTDVIAGIPDHRDVVLSDAEKSSGKVMQICVSRALSERLVLNL